MIVRFSSLLTAFVFTVGSSAIGVNAAAMEAGFPPANTSFVSNGTGTGEAGARTSPAAPVSVDSAIAHSADTDDRVARADSHFNAGRQLYFEGDLTGARREFDAAVDALLTAPDNAPDHGRIERRLDEICDLIYRFDVENLGAGQAEEAAVTFDKAPIDEISHMTFPVDPNLAPKVKSELNQTASGIPLELADPVLSYIHYFSSDGGRKILLAGFERSGRYKPMIERIFGEEGVPQELVYLAQAESGFLPRAISYKSAGGMWQFTPAAALDYNLARNTTLDQRFDPEIATRAAARYLKDMYARYGDWYLAMAAYNCGPGVVDKAVERTGYADYWELLKRHALPKETANYVPIILAMTIMAKNPADYGLQNIQTDAPVEYDTLHLTASTNLNLIADATLQPVSVIRDLNPALLRSMAPEDYQIHVPKGTGESAQVALETVPAANRQAWRLHRVESGDTLEAIARAYHLAPERIVAVNQGADSLSRGDVLLIPAVFHEDAPALRKRSRAKSSAGHSSKALVARRSSSSQRSTHATASRHVPAQILHRKAAVRTASIE